MSTYFKEVLALLDEFFQKNYKETQDKLVMEALLYLVDFFKFMLNSPHLHSYINSQRIVPRLIEMLKLHHDPQVVTSLSGAIHEVSKFALFYPDLLGEE